MYASIRLARNRVRLPGERKSLQMQLKDSVRRDRKKPFEIKPKQITDDPWAMVEPKGKASCHVFNCNSKNIFSFLSKALRGYCN